MLKHSPIRYILVLLISIVEFSICFAQPNNIQSLSCGTPDAFSLGNSGFVGSNPTTAAGSCGQCCYSGSDLDGDGDQDVSYSVENSVWYEYCNPSGSVITVDIVIDEVFDNCNVQGAVFTGNPSTMDVDCSNPGFQEYGSNPGGNGDGFTFTVTLNPGECAWVMIDGYGGATCSDLTIEVPCCTAPTSLTAGPDAIICEGQSTPLDATLSGGLVAQGGPTFSWSPISGLSCSNCEDPTASPTITTTYTLTACNDADGLACCLTDQVQVTVVPAFIPDAGADVTACAPSSVTIGGAPTGPNGSIYSWALVGGDNGGIAISAGSTSANPTVSISAGASGSETYEVTVTNGPCVFTDQVTVSVGPLLVDAGPISNVCVGGIVQIGGAPTAPAGASYSWTCTNCNDISINTSSSSNPSLTVGPTASGTATYTVQASLGSCFNSASVDVIVDPLPTTPVASASPLLVCDGGQTTLSASGGAGSGTFTWWDASSGGTQIGAGNSLVVSPVGATTYYLESTDPATGCVSLRSAVTVNTTVAAVADAGNDASVCQGDPLSLSGLINNPESCGTQTWSVVSGSGTFSPDANAINPTFTPSSTGQITLQLTPCSSGGPCPVVPDNIILTIDEAPSLTAWPDDDTLCQGESLITGLNSTITGGSPAPTSTNYSFSANGPYPIPNNDCSNGVTVPINVSGVADPVVGATTVSVCLNIDLNNVDDIQIELCAPGGSPCVVLVPAPNNGMAGSDFTGTCFTDASATSISSGVAPYTGNYAPYGTAAMSDFNGVSTNGTWTLTVYDCTGGPSGDLDDWSINFDTPLPNQPYNCMWSPSGGLTDPTNQNTSFSSDGYPVSTVTKTLTVSDENNCSSSMDVTIEIVDCTILLSLERPITLLNFKGQKLGSSNLLSWEVSSEGEIDHYRLEHATDGITFSLLDIVESEGSSTPKQVSFTDQIPLNDQTYYRLACIHFDGSIHYSQVILLSHLSNASQNAPKIYPNPARSDLYIQWQNPIESSTSISLLNIHGQIIRQYDDIKLGSKEARIALHDIPKGMYVVELVSKDGVFKKSIVIK